MKLRDDQQLEAEQTIVLLRLQQVFQVVVPWLIKVLDCHLEHYRSMITPLNVMERLIAEHLDVERSVILVQDSVTVGRSLVFLVNILVCSLAQFVAW